ncbi:MAG: DUF2171 domain-containing protein [Thermomicrobiales bacterium]
MDPMTQQWQFAVGTEVFDANGDKVGKVEHIGPDYIMVEKGFIFHKDLYIPKSAISNYEGGQIYLSVTNDEAKNRGWEMKPGDIAPTDAGVDNAGTWSGTPGT